MSADRLPWHEPLWHALVKLARNDRLPHALLLTGRPGLGKTQFAARAAAALVCRHPDAAGDACNQCAACLTRKAGSYPDIKIIEPEQVGKPIRIDVIREMSERSVLAAEGDGYKVFILNFADQLTHGAANALLKTLEEPTSRSLLMLVTSRPEKLPATIRSRCQQLRFGVPDVAVSRAWLEQRDGGAGAIEVLDAAGGAPLLALQMTLDGSADLLATLRHDVRQLVDERTNPIALAANWQKHDLELVLNYLGQWIVDLVRLKTLRNPPLLFDTTERADLHRLAQRIEFNRLFRLLDDLATTRRRSTHNLNLQLILEYHLTEFGRLTVR